MLLLHWGDDLQRQTPPGPRQSQKSHAPPRRLTDRLLPPAPVKTGGLSAGKWQRGLKVDLAGSPPTETAWN